MTDYLSKYSARFENRHDSIDIVIVDFVDQINKQWQSKSISAIHLKTTGDSETYVTHAIHLTTPIGRSYYTYRFISVKQPIDNDLPVLVTAFQNPPMKEIEINEIRKFKEWLIEIMGDIRTRIVENHLSQLHQNFDFEE